MNQLNQVIRIHGFKKIHHAPKKVLVDAVDLLDLMDLPRSTLGESISAFAVLTVEDAVADLNELNWQECCVTSIQKLCSCDNQSLFPVSSNQNLRIMNHSQSQSKVQKTKRIEEICGLIPEAFKSSLQATKMVPKRRRSNVHALDCAASTVDSVSLASC
ncbi:uncharacterized protein LOC133315260 [Gastrolobium bilobum]|uniref:uncharacterized protein LOC133315260 n=1 Tax=Gastrolobium bilobum TaxID=150636 RepID=UPI002AAF3103|nr:uncharacterized protein LOC133315260 [Gastrolobium bilobum]